MLHGQPLVHSNMWASLRMASERPNLVVTRAPWLGFLSVFAVFCVLGVPNLLCSGEPSSPGALRFFCGGPRCAACSCSLGDRDPEGVNVSPLGCEHRACGRPSRFARAFSCAGPLALARARALVRSIVRPRAAARPPARPAARLPDCCCALQTYVYLLRGACSSGNGD